MGRFDSCVGPQNEPCMAQSHAARCAATESRETGQKEHGTMKEINVESSAGKKYGHVPGHQYHDVDVTIDRSAAGRWTVEIIETWGSCQGRDEEHGRKTVMACGRSLEEAVEKVTARAEGADINRSYLVQALSCARSEEHT